MSIAVFAGCDPSETISLPKPEPRLVINCVGINDYEWHAVLSLPENALYGDFYKQIEDATIKIYENGIFSETIPFKKLDDHPLWSGWYVGMSKPKPGNIYKILVRHPDYPQIESEYKQPESIEIQNVEITNVRVDPFNLNAQITIGFDDLPGENYYEVSATARDSAGMFQFSGYLTFIDPVYKEYTDLFPRSTAFDDVYFNGKPAKLDFGFSANSYINFDVSSFTIYLRHISKDYYQYLKTTTIQKEFNDDPFAQPVLISNNITNGYGLFGGITETSKTVYHHINSRP